MNTKEIYKGIGFALAFCFTFCAAILFLHWAFTGKTEYITTSATLATIALVIVTMVYVRLLLRQLEVMGSQLNQSIISTRLAHQPCVYAWPEHRSLLLTNHHIEKGAFQLVMPFKCMNSGQAPAIGVYIHGILLEQLGNSEKCKTQTQGYTFPIIAPAGSWDKEHGKFIFTMHSNNFALKKLLSVGQIGLEMKSEFRNLLGGKFTISNRFRIDNKSLDQFASLESYEKAEERLREILSSNGKIIMKLVSIAEQVEVLAQE